MQASHPSIVVMIDCDLSDMSGYQLAMALREQERAHARPPALLVAFSAASSQHHVQRCRASGMDAVLCKPLDPSQLLAVLGIAPAPATVTAKIARDDPAWTPLVQSLQEESQALRTAQLARATRPLCYHAHRIAGVLRMLGHETLADTAADLHELGLSDGANWEEIDRLLDHVRRGIAALGEPCVT